MGVDEDPQLGLTTTEELFRELIARFQIHAYLESSVRMTDRVDRDYRTVDS